jgi:glycosyltransferase involved in cell wall biosynthesis
MRSPEKVKVCHFTSAHKADDIRIFHKECVSLAEAGYEVYLVSDSNDGEMHNGVRYVSAGSPQRSRLKRMLFTSKEVYRKARSVNADIYHFHDPELLRFALRLKRQGKKVVYDAHEDLPRQILGKEYLRFKKLIAALIEWYENSIAKRVDLVVTATPFIAARFRKVNPNTIDINNFPLLHEVDLQDSVAERDPRRICFIGNISRIRGVKQLVEALSGTDIKLDLAGKVPDDLRAELLAIDGWKNVNELGYIDRKKSLEIKSTASAGVVTFLPLPNHVNAQPNKIFEYMASGLPVIGSDFPLWKLIIEENNCGICADPADPSKLRRAILQLLENREELVRQGANGKRLVIEKYNWDAEKKKLREVYGTL